MKRVVIISLCISVAFWICGCANQENGLPSPPNGSKNGASSLSINDEPEKTDQKLVSPTMDPQKTQTKAPSKTPVKTPVKTPAKTSVKTPAKALDIAVSGVSVSTNKVLTLNQVVQWGFSRNTQNKSPRFESNYTSLLSKYDGVCIADTSQKKVYITFDEGYENGYTAKILDALKKNDVKALFFITGPYLKNQSVLIKRMIDEGHSIGNHTVNHPSLPSISESDMKEEISGLDNEYFKLYQKKMSFLRPPKGEFSEKSLMVAKNLGHRTMLWSSAFDDWDTTKQKGTQYSYDMVVNNLHNGAVILMHAVSKDNAEAMDRIIKAILEKGYKIGSPEELS